MKLVLAFLFGLIASAAQAQTPSFYQLQDNGGNKFNVGVFLCPTNKICPLSVSSDALGNPLSGTIGNTNPNGTALYVQGVMNGVPVPTIITGTLPAFASVPHFICDSGCNSGNLSVTFGMSIGTLGIPGGFKDASGNFQSLLGDTTNGQWVSIKSAVPLNVTGTFWQTTQPISAASLPLPNGAATQTTLASILAALVTPSLEIGITPTDHTITSTTGVSQSVMTANASRHSLTIVNNGSISCGINPTGGTAVIGGAGTFTLTPNGAYSPRVPTLSAVTAICPAGQQLYADDN